jgi:hypothetical protein
LWLQREWLKEYPERNITEIHFEHSVSRKYFKVSKEKVSAGIVVMGEGYEGRNFLYPLEGEEENVEFLRLKPSQEEDFRFFRAPSEIIEVMEDDYVQTDIHQVENLTTIYTSIYPVPSMVGGPLINLFTDEVVGVISHESDDPYNEGGIRGVLIGKQ